MIFHPKSWKLNDSPSKSWMLGTVWKVSWQSLALIETMFAVHALLKLHIFFLRYIWLMRLSGGTFVKRSTYLSFSGRNVCVDKSLLSKVPANCEDWAQQLVLNLVFHVTLALANLDVTLQNQGHSNWAECLGKKSIHWISLVNQQSSYGCCRRLGSHILLDAAGHGTGYSNDLLDSAP